MKRNSIYKQISLSLLLLVGAVGSAWGQINFNHSVTELQNKLQGNNDISSEYYTLRSDGLQPTHEYTKTIYIKAGEGNGKLLEPYAMAANYMNTYLRWFVKGNENGSANWLNTNTNIAELKQGDGSTSSYSATNGYGYVAFNVKNWASGVPTNEMCYPTLTFKDTEIPEGLTLVMEASNDPNITSAPTGTFIEPILAYRYLLEIKDIDDFMTDVEAPGYIDEVRKRVDATAGMFFQVRLTQPLNNYWGTKTGDTATTTEGYLEKADVTLNVTAPSGASTGTEDIYIDNTGKILIIEDPKEGEYTVTLKNGTITLDEYVITFLPISEAGMFLDKDLKKESEYYELSEAYLDSLKRQGELQSLGKIDFDDDEYLNHLANYNKEEDAYYPYPILPWSQSSYAWAWSTQNTQDFDYAAYRIATTSNATNYHSFVQAVGKTVYGHGAHTQQAGEDAFMYNNVANEPGKMLELVWDGTICSSCRLYVTFCMNEFSEGETGNVEVAITGVKEDGTREVLQTYITGYIPKYYNTTKADGKTAYVDNSSPEERKHPLYYSSESKFIPCRGEWMQVYYSFTPNFDPAAYTSFVFTINNNTKNSGGADFALDDFHVYMGTLQVEAETEEPVCASDIDEKIRLRFEYERLINRIWGDKDEDGQEASKTGYYCFIDKEVYDNKLNEEKNNISEAFNAALVQGDDIYIQKTGSTETESDSYGSFVIYRDESAYENTTSDDGVADLIEEDGIKYLTFVSNIAIKDGKAPLMPGKEYYVAYATDVNEEETDNLYQYFDLEEICTVKGTFVVEGQLIEKINGTVDDDSSTPCIGQAPKISIQMKDKEKNPVEGVRFDWFFGTREEFDAVKYDPNSPDKEDNTLEYALAMFRHFYPNNTDMSNVEVQATDGDGYYLTEEMIGLLETLNTNEIPGYENPQLSLSGSEELIIRLMEAETHVVVIPINDQPAEIEDDVWTQLCWEPSEIILRAQNGSPLLDVGFEEVTYPQDPSIGEYVNVRADLTRLNEIQEKEMVLHIPVKNPRIITEDDDETEEETVTCINEDLGLYLLSTDDPKAQKLFDEGNETPVCIGSINNDFKASPSDQQSYVHLKFNNANNAGESKLTFREGYKYNLSFNFKIENVDESEDPEVCYGNLIIPIYVVPAYQKWVGGTDGNWNDDENWKRSDKDELKKGDDYTTNADNYKDTDKSFVGNGFVPLSTTYVTIPRDNQIQLYNPRKKDDQSGILNLKEGKDGTNIDDATHYIEYDLVIEETSRDITGGGKEYRVVKYYTNKANEIHFEPNAEMLRAELLDYNKAWVDYELEKGRWYTLASPLNGVVAGDFYTDSDKGTEEQEYFTDIYFDKDDYEDGSQPNGYDKANNRFKPSVYQRGWKDSETYVIKGSDENDKEDVSITSGIWSGAYNDVKEQYTPGTGFSLKVQDIKDDAKAIFRLPKADGEYGYFEYNETTATTTETVDRGEEEKIGKLKSDDLKTEGADITVQLTNNNGSEYYLLGNPFMTSLNMDEFFEENTGLQKKYWMVTENNQEVAVGDENGWVSTSSSTVSPLQSFFVVKNDESIEQVTFTKGMQTLGETDDDETTDESTTFYLTVQNAAGKTSRAAIAYDIAADKDYAADEDAELFLDSNLSDVPAIYTVAGSTATSINRTSELYNIPVGIYGNSNELVTLSFSGLKHIGSATLYDAEEKTETPLREGKTIQVPGNTSGRYFLRAGTPTTNETIETGDIQIYSLSGNRVMVTATTPLKDIRVYDMGGAVVKHVKAGVCSFELYLANGIYVITAENAEGETETAKVVVR